MEIYRTQQEYLDKWIKLEDRRPLIIRGARQVGKSFLVNSWCKKIKQYDLVEINFEERPDAISIFELNLDINRILDELNILTGKNLRSENVVLFFDEIQKAPKAISALRFFYEKFPKLPVIAAGSLLEFILDKISFPVGRTESLFLPPLSFSEYLNSIKNKEVAKAYESLNTKSSNEGISKLLHSELIEHLRVYYRIGGMPKAVSNYLDSKDYSEVIKIHNILLQGYKDDFIKYGDKVDFNTLNLVFEKLPLCIGNTRVKYVKFSRDIRAEKIKNSLNLLEKAHLITKVYSSHSEKPPLASGVNIDNFKLLFLDIGLLQRLLGFDWSKVPLDTDLSNIKDGQFAEQFVGQELIASNSLSTRFSPFYWDRPRKGADAEVDYLIERDNKIIPIEVKSGERGKLRSLRQYLKEHPSDKALVLSQNNASNFENINFLPLYFTGKI